MIERYKMNTGMRMKDDRQIQDEYTGMRIKDDRKIQDEYRDKN